MNEVQKMPRYVPHTLQHWTRVIADLDIRVSARACGIRLCSMAGVWAGILATSVIWVVNLYGLSKKCTADSKQLFAVWTPNKRAAAQFQAIPVPPQTLILTSDFTERNRNLIYSIITATIRESNCYFLKLQDTEWSTGSNRWFFFLVRIMGGGTQLVIWASFGGKEGCLSDSTLGACGWMCTLQVQRGSVLLRHSIKELPHPSGFALIFVLVLMTSWPNLYGISFTGFNVCKSAVV